MSEAGPLSLVAFRRLWAAAAVSGFGSYVTIVAVQVLVVERLRGSATDVGLVNGARWLPYLLFGLVAGVLVDRRRRRPVLVAADFARAALLVAIPLLSWAGALSVPALMVVMIAFGTLSLGADAAAQSFVPRVVPPHLTTPANARLDQSDAAAQTAGPAIGGALVSAMGAPVAVLFDAASYLVSAFAIGSIEVAEPAPAQRHDRHFRRELAEGLRWVYGHRTLRPLAVWTHGWFLFFAMFTTVLTPFVLRELGLSAFGLGLVLASAGVGALVGSSLATRLGASYGAGRVAVAAWLGNAAGIAIVVLAPASAAGGVIAGGVVVGVGQFVVGITMGIENANTLGFRQAVTPDGLQGRTNTTMRSVNRAMVVVGAPLGGVLADAAGFRPALWVSAAGIATVALALVASPFRAARLPQPQ
jgi:MFS family permease